MMTDSWRSFLLVLVAALFPLAFAGPAQAQSAGQIGAGKNVGLGLGNGTLTSGVTAKFYLDQRSAIQLFAGNFGGWGPARCRSCGLSLSGDYMYEFADLVNESAGRLFAGGGGGVFLYNYNTFDRYRNGYYGVGFHGTFELGWHFAEFPLEFVLDVRPAIDLGRYYSNFFIDGGGAIRIFF